MYKMAKYRRGRINDAVAEEMAVALRDLRDPRLTDNFVSITRADVAGDLRVAKIYFSAMGDAEVYKAAKAALEAAKKAKKNAGALPDIPKDSTKIKRLLEYCEKQAKYDRIN